MTVLSVDYDPDPPENVHYVHMEGTYDYMYKEIFVDLVGLHNETTMHSVLSLYAFGTVSCIGIKIKAYTHCDWLHNVMVFKVLQGHKDLRLC